MRTDFFLGRIFQILIVAVALVLPSALLAAEGADRDYEPLRLRVLSYNIHHGEGIDGKLDLPRIAKAIKAVEPDLVVLQEVDKGTQRTNRVDQPAELARQLDIRVVFGGNISFQGGDYGNAVLSRFPVSRSKNHLLPRFDDGEQRGALEVSVELPDGHGSLQIVATHLDHRADDRERFASAKAINQLAANMTDRPAILAGDLNDLPNSRTLSELGKLWTPANTKDMPTIPVGQPTRQIDFILFRPTDRWQAVEVQVLDEAVASDHRAILAVLELRPARATVVEQGEP